MLPLKALLQQKGMSQARLARKVKLSPATIAQLLNKGIWPTNPPRDALQASITAVLTAKGIAVSAAHFEPAPIAEDAEKNHNAQEGIDMLLRKQTLSPQARKHFGLFRDPFDNDVTEASDVFVTPDSRYVREAMWSTAKLGGFIAVAGESGSGKSTLAALLCGLRPPDSGLLLLHGLDKAAWGVQTWRRTVAAAPQFHENYIFSAPFAFNLLMGRRWPPNNEDLQEAEQVCQGLGLGDLLERMPAGLMQMVGETGWRLSHGERSRVFLARALLQEAHVIVLDESFGALDPETLGQCLTYVMQRAPTLVVIAHP